MSASPSQATLPLLSQSFRGRIKRAFPSSCSVPVISPTSTPLVLSSFFFSAIEPRWYLVMLIYSICLILSSLFFLIVCFNALLPACLMVLFSVFCSFCPSQSWSLLFFSLSSFNMVSSDSLLDFLFFPFFYYLFFFFSVDFYTLSSNPHPPFFFPLLSTYTVLY